MVVIRLARGGAKKKPFYHVVVTDCRNPRDGRYIERVGIFNPVARGADIYLRLNQERLNHWVKLGAQASARVKQLQELFAKTGEITGIALAVSRANRKPKHKKQTAVAAPENNAGEAA